MSDTAKENPFGWTDALIEDCFAPLEDGRTMHQGWSPQCEKHASPSDDVWGVLKTTSIQAGEFQPEHNKRLPNSLKPRPLIEVKPGDILITCAGPRVRCGVSCLVRNTRPRLMMSGKMYRFRVPADRVDPRYVEAFLQTEEARQSIDKMKTGSSESGLNLTHNRFRQLSIPVAPYLEQRRIVAEIEKQFTRLEAGVAALKRVQANLKRYRAAVLKSACEGKFVPTEAELAKKEKRTYETGEELLKRILAERRKNWNGRGTYKDPVELNCDEKLSTLPTSWTWTSLDCLVEKITDGEHLSPKKTKDGMMLLTATHITDRGVVFVDPQFVSVEEGKSFRQRCDPRRGDVLICSRGTIGRCAIVNSDEIFCLMGSVILVRIMKELCPEYFNYFLSTNWAQEQMRGLSGATAVQALYLKDIRRCPIALPPIVEQKRIVKEVDRRLSIIDELEVVVKLNLDRATRLRQSILQKAFSGRLYVNS